MNFGFISVSVCMLVQAVWVLLNPSNFNACYELSQTWMIAFAISKCFMQSMFITMNARTFNGLYFVCMRVVCVCLCVSCCCVNLLLVLFFGALKFIFVTQVF